MNKVIATLLFFLAGAPAARAEHELRAEIAEARTRVPGAFAQLAELRARVVATPPPVERRGHVARAMRALGRDGLYPLLQLVTDDSLARETPAARRLLLVGALEALGQLRDRRAAATLEQLVDAPGPAGAAASDAEVQRSAAEALGALGGDAELAFLTERAQPGQARERAAIAGLGYLRRAAAADVLRARLHARPDGETAAAVAEAMGWLGSAWAWDALGPTRAAEGEAVRAQLADALASAYAGYEGRARTAIGRALLLVQHPTTPNRLAQLRASAGPALASDVQHLERLWQQSLSH